MLNLTSKLPSRNAIVKNLRLALLCAGFGFSGYWFTWTAAKSMIAQDANLEAQTWSRHLHSDRVDYTALLNGLRPSDHMQSSFAHAGEFGGIVEISFHDLNGKTVYHQRIASEQQDDDASAVTAEGKDHEDTEVDLNVLERYPQLKTSSLAQGENILDIREADDAGETGLESDVLLPLYQSGNLVGYALIELDQTPRWNGMVKAIWPLSFISSALFLLCPLGFSIALQRKSRSVAVLSQALGTDLLTGLGSRQALYDFEQELKKTGGGVPDGMAIYYLDVDKFKNLNDSFGHEFGDEVLKSIGTHIRTLAEKLPGLRAYRLGGDEFVLVLDAVATGADAVQFAIELQDVALQSESPIGTKLTCSVGVYLQQDSSGGLLQFDQALARSDAALYVSKAKGGNASTLFDAQMDKEWQSQKQVSQLLMESETTKPFKLHYQPYFDLQTGALMGFEALIRMRSPDGKLIPPDKFIPLAERNGSIENIGARCLIAACVEASRWPANIKVSVNISPVQFRSGNLVVHLKTALDLAGIQASQLEVEVTESILVEDVESVTSQLEDIKALGVSIALDDFGTGYSSLSYLWRFPFNKIKIDKSFVQKIEQDDGAFKILATIIDLAQQLGFETTAEGIETDKQKRTLQELGCTLGQGYLYSRPVEDEQARLVILRSQALAMVNQTSVNSELHAMAAPADQFEIAAAS